jgi:hypothetical protein
MPVGAGHGGLAFHGRSPNAVYAAMGVLASFRPTENVRKASDGAVSVEQHLRQGRIIGAD